MESTLGDRVRATREQLGISRPQLAAMTKIGYSTLAEIENGGMRSTTKLHVIARELGVSVDWLATGSGAPGRTTSPVSTLATPAGYVRFPLLEGFAGMGRGDYVGDYPEIVDFVEVTREWAEQTLRGIPFEDVRVITGRGPSMRGMFNDGDPVFLDSRVKRFLGDAVYCFRWNGLVYIKKLQMVGKGTARILSANPDYEPVDAPMQELEIGGRARAAWTLKEF